MTGRQRALKRQRAAEHAAMVRRILAHWRASTAAELEAGLAWYDRAEVAARAIAAGTPYSTREAAAVIAVLSPRVHWRQNVDAAAQLVDYASHAESGPYPVVPALGANVDKAAAILAGADPDEILRGPKVRAFFANITGDHGAVTVDVWAHRAATGRRVKTFGAGEYARVADAYRAAAAKLGVPARDLQAAVWVHIRGSAD